MEMYLTNECSLDEVALEEITPTINIHYNGELDKYLSCTIGNEEELENINPTCYSVLGLITTYHGMKNSLENNTADRLWQMAMSIVFAERQNKAMFSTANTVAMVALVL